jgi:putative membrane protein
MFWHDGVHMFGINGMWMLIFWIVIIVWMVWLLSTILSHNLESHQPAPSRFKTADHIAKERYARGEISREEYQTILNDLK